MTLAEWFAGLPAGELSTAALLGLAVWLILTGKIVPKSTHEEVRQDRNEWKQAYINEARARSEQEAQIEKLLVLADTIHAVIAALGTVPVKDREEDG